MEIELLTSAPEKFKVFMLNALFLIGGLVLIIFAAGWLVDGASALARRFGISDMVIGLTIVAFGTSAPELTINIFSALSGSTDLAVGNVLGSNLSNILLILGISALIAPIPIGSTTRWKEIPFSLLGALVLGFMANDVLLDGEGSNLVSHIDGWVLLCFMAIFMVYTFGMARNTEEVTLETRHMPVWKGIGLFIVGLAGLFFGGKYMVEGAVNLATLMGMSERVIGLTIVAIGTSLPELATSVVAAMKKKMDIAIGNVVGSNIFNVFFVLGTTAVLEPLPFHPNSNFDLMAVIIASVMLFLTGMRAHHSSITRGHGLLFLICYIAYLTFLIFQ